MTSSTMTSSTMTHYHLRLLGRFELSLGGFPVRISPGGERLLAYLAVHTEPVYRHAVASALWPDHPDVRATANLRSTLWRLHSQQKDELIGCRGGTVALTPDTVVDLNDLSGQLGSPLVADEVSVATLRQDVLPDWPEDWLITTREWFRQIRLRALESLSDHYRDDGRLDAALSAGLAAVTCDPLRESAHRRLVLVHMAEGNFADALRQYHTYRQLSRTELGLPPSPQFRRLVAPLLGRPLDSTA